MKSTGQSILAALQRLKTLTDLLSDSYDDPYADPASLDLLALEDRVLFDAAPLDIEPPEIDPCLDCGFGDEMPADPLGELLDIESIAETLLNDYGDIEPADRLEYLESLINEQLDTQAEEQTDALRSELLVVDVSIENWQQFVAEAVDQSVTRVEVVLIDAGRDGVAAVGSALQRLGQVDAIHVLAHGEAGRFQLGSVVVSADTLTELAPRFQQWQDGMSADADLLLYGCNVAASDEGVTLLAELSDLTGADVAASNDLTGHVALQGNWALEHATGNIETAIIVSAELQDEWFSILPVAIDPEVTTGPSDEYNVTDRDERGSGHAVAMDADGNYMIVWTRDVGSSYGYDVFAQQFDADGNSSGEFRVNDNRFGDQRYASVDVDGDGNYTVTWSDLTYDDVESRVYFADGSNSGEFDIADDAFNSSVAVSERGDVVYVWERDDKIYASYFSSDGFNNRFDFRVDRGFRNGAEDPDVAIDEFGYFVVAWEDNDGIEIQRFDNTGFRYGGEDRIFSDSGNDRFHNPSVGLRSDGSIIVVAGASYNGDRDVIAAIVQPDTSQVEFGISETTTNNQRNASISVNGDDSFIITWHGYGNQPDNFDDSGVFFRAFDAAGNGDAEQRVNDYTSGNQRYASVASLSNKSFVVVWSGETATQDDGIGLKQFLPEIFISGTVHNDVDADGQFADDGQQFAGVNVLLFADSNGDGQFDSGDLGVDATTTDGSGNYQFTVTRDGTWFVVVDSQSIGTDQVTNALYSAADLWAEQTYGSSGSLIQDGPGDAFTSEDGTLFGGRRGDAGDDLGDVATMEHVTRVSVLGHQDVGGVDSAFSFNVVTHTGGGDVAAVSGQVDQGSLRQFLINANALAGANTMRFVPTSGPNEATRQSWRIDIDQLLPIIEDGDTVVDGQAYSTSDGNQEVDGDSSLIGTADTIVGTGQYDLDQIDRPELELFDTGGLSHGLHVDADRVTVTGIRVEGFGSTANTDSANIVVHDAADFRLTNSHLINGGYAGLITEGGQDGQVKHNVISGNAAFGIGMYGGSQPVVNWLISENFIFGNATVITSADGIDVQFGGSNNEISRNWIADNMGSGIDSYQSSGTILILDNTITGNGFGGGETSNVRLFGDNNLVQGNVITGAAGNGVQVIGSSLVSPAVATGNQITENEFGGNGGLAIDLVGPSLSIIELQQGDGLSDFSGNPPGAANQGILSPVLASTTIDDGTTTVTGTAGVGERVEIYLAVADGDGSDTVGGDSYGEGVRFLGWVMTDGAGNFEFTSTDLLVTDSVVAIAIDSQGNTSEFSRNQEVNAVPTADDLTFNLSQGDSFVVDLDLFNYQDDDGDPLVGVYVDTVPDNVQLLLNGSSLSPGQYIEVADLLAGDLRIEVPIGVAGDPLDTVEFRLFDGTATSETITVEINVDNTDPVFSTARNILMLENTDSFFVEASDPDGGSVVYEIVGGADAGLFSINQTTGEITFNDSPDFENPHDDDENNFYRIEVVARDAAGGESMIDLTVRIIDVNEPINGASLRDNHVEEMAADGTRIGVVDVDDPDRNDTWQFELLDDADGRFSIDPDTGELFVADGDALNFEDAMAHGITVQVTDAELHSVIVDFVIEVDDINELPVAVDQLLDVDEGDRLTIDPSTFAGLIDPDGDRLEFTVFSDPVHGTVEVRPDGTFVYQHNGSETLTDSFQYQIDDGRGGFDTATISLDINPVNDAPVAENDLLITTDGLSITILPGKLMQNDVDVDSVNLTFQIVGGPSEGTLEANADGTYTYTPPADGSGFATFQYTVSDGEFVSNVATVEIIFSVLQNDPPLDPNESDPVPDGDPDPVDLPDPDTGEEDDEDEFENTGPVTTAELGADTENNGGSSTEFESATTLSGSESLNTIYGFSYQKSEIIVSSLFLQADGQAVAAGQPLIASAFALSSMWQDFDQVNEDLLGNVSVATGTVAAAASLTGVFTLGYVFWMARGGMLVASLVSSTTAWRSFDPLPILQYAAEHDDAGESDSLQSLLSRDS